MKRRRLHAIDLGKRFRAEEQFCKSLFAVEEEITTKIEEALAEENYGAVGGLLREFYTRVCDLIDRTKKEMEAIRIPIPAPKIPNNPGRMMPKGGAGVASVEKERKTRSKTSGKKE
jgi:hypothetical protein